MNHLKKRCPHCIEMHFEKRYSGTINGDREFFCQPECYTEYFSAFETRRDFAQEEDNDPTPWVRRCFGNRKDRGTW